MPSQMASSQMHSQSSPMQAQVGSAQMYAQNPSAQMPRAQTPFPAPTSRAMSAPPAPSKLRRVLVIATIAILVSAVGILIVLLT
jgi:hypothetical protein